LVRFRSYILKYVREKTKKFCTALGKYILF
jgi:hypothetical protein